jgi:hypothetical protein
MENIKKISTRHPDPAKKGRNIDKEKYDILKDTIVSCLKLKRMTHDALMECISSRLKGKFDGNIEWYAETVKLDLEAKRIIRRTDDKPQKYVLR